MNESPTMKMIRARSDQYDCVERETIARSDSRQANVERSVKGRIVVEQTVRSTNGKMRRVAHVFKDVCGRRIPVERTNDRKNRKTAKRHRMAHTRSAKNAAKRMKDDDVL